MTQISDSTPFTIPSLIQRMLELTRYIPDAGARVVKHIVLYQLQSIEGGTLLVRDTDESETILGLKQTGSTTTIVLTIKSARAWTRILLGNDIGFAEAFMLDELTCSDLAGFFRLLLKQPDTAGSSLESLANIATASLHRLSNTAEQALRNASSHYSLSNDMFEAFLDSSMTYSAPLWLSKSNPAASKDSLEAAQIRKLDYTIKAARIKPEDHVLEIGTGWGSFAIRAVEQTGCRVTTVTASDEQARLAKEKVRAAGLGDRIRVLVCDYRHIPLHSDDVRYDKVVSIEMIEHVGKAFLNTYFSCIDAYLKLDGGIGVFQCITIPEARYSGYCKRRDFIQRYIFPGGHLPTVSGLVASIDAGSKGRLVVDDIKSLSGHYVRALREWRENFDKHWDTTIEPALRRSQIGLSAEDAAVFGRKWEYYFCYCEAGFATKKLGDVSIVVGREGAMELIDDIPF